MSAVAGNISCFCIFHSKKPPQQLVAPSKFAWPFIPGPKIDLIDFYILCSRVCRL